MKKKSIIILIIILVIAVILIGGIRSLRQYQAHKLAEEYIKALQTGDYGQVAKILEKLEKQGSGVPGMFPGVTEDTGMEDEKEESPQSIYNKLSAVPISDPFTQEIDDAVKEAFQEVFGGAKLVGYNINSFGSGISSVSYTVKRPTESADVGKLINAFTNRNYSIVSSRIDAEDETGHLMVKNNEIGMSLSFEIDKVSQDITIFALPAESEELEMLQFF